MSQEPDDTAGSVDPSELVELLEVLLLGETPGLTGEDVAELSGVDREVARARWKSLGFIQVPDDEVAFTHGDVHAIQLMERLHDLGLANEGNEAALVRSYGRTFSRLADFDVQLLTESVDLRKVPLSELAELISELSPLLEEAMNYVWRRHLFSAASRVVLGASGSDNPPMVVGFADIVGFTARSRTMSVEELAELVESFESRSMGIIAARGGRVIKTIGDEVLYVADSAAQGALIALELAEESQADPEFPELRVGVAYGPVLSRMGDVFGPVVNIAARLTSVARPGTVVVDRSLAEALEGSPEFRTKRLGRAVVKGYRHLEVSALRRPRGRNGGDSDEDVTAAATQ